MQLSITWLGNPSGMRQNSWLFGGVAEELNLGLPRTEASGQNMT